MQVQMPRTRAECQRVLREFGYTGLKIDQIVTDDATTGRVFALTGPVLEQDGKMRRRACTLVFSFTRDDVTVTREEGWVV